MNQDIATLVKACEYVLQIKKTVHIVLKTRGRGKTKNLAGYCDSVFRNDRFVAHKIVVHLDTVVSSGYNMVDVIAHEFVHASMLEHGLFNPEYHHDKTFQHMAELLKTYLTNCGFQIGVLYDPAIDTD
jgi:hypothetical protein